MAWICPCLWALSRLNGELYLGVSSIGLVVLMTLGLPVTQLILAAVISIFGNSPGKALLAIQVLPGDGRPRLDFAAAVRREYAVWVHGFALGIHPGSLYTALLALTLVSAGEPTRYDRNGTNVWAFSKNPVRLAFGVLLAAVVYAAILSGLLGRAWPALGT